MTPPSAFVVLAAAARHVFRTCCNSLFHLWIFFLFGSGCSAGYPKAMRATTFHPFGIFSRCLTFSSLKSPIQQVLLPRPRRRARAAVLEHQRRSMSLHLIVDSYTLIDDVWHTLLVSSNSTSISQQLSTPRRGLQRLPAPGTEHGHIRPRNKSFLESSLSRLLPLRSPDNLLSH